MSLEIPYLEHSMPWLTLQHITLECPGLSLGLSAMLGMTLGGLVIM